ncbi:Wall-associated receptor kinase [Theobroma cacao]|nr:Wall-associated receptor kinase [Theobroma cacao]
MFASLILAYNQRVSFFSIMDAPLVVSYSQDDVIFTSCYPFDCGNLRNLLYPFWTDDLDGSAYCGYDRAVFVGKKDDVHFTLCDPFECGNFRNLSYPFWTDDLHRPAYCAYDHEAYKLKCKQNQPPVITIGSQEFQVVHLYQPRGLMTIQRLELGENTCPQEIFTYNIINYSDTAANITLFYDC